MQEQSNIIYIYTQSVIKILNIKKKTQLYVYMKCVTIKCFLKHNVQVKRILQYTLKMNKNGKKSFRNIKLE